MLSLREQFEAALEWLKGRGDVRPQKIGGEVIFVRTGDLNLYRDWTCFRCRKFFECGRWLRNISGDYSDVLLGCSLREEEVDFSSGDLSAVGSVIGDPSVVRSAIDVGDTDGQRVVVASEIAEEVDAESGGSEVRFMRRRGRPRKDGKGSGCDR